MDIILAQHNVYMHNWVIALQPVVNVQRAQHMRILNSIKVILLSNQQVAALGVAVQHVDCNSLIV